MSRVRRVVSHCTAGDRFVHARQLIVTMSDIPRESGFDHTLAFKREPYEYISKGCRRLASDVFETRLLGRKTLCMRGRLAAQLFYNPRYFMRHGAAPEPLQKTLLGTSGIQTLDDAAHRHRKAMFLAMMSASRIAALGQAFRSELQLRAQEWSREPQIVLYDEVQRILTRCVCAWAGVPLQKDDVRKRTAQLIALFDYAGRGGVKHLRSRLARRQAEQWLGGMLEAVRHETMQAPDDSALDRIARHRDLNGELMPTQAAAVELLNVLRPSVAVSVYIVFLVHALHRFPETRSWMPQGDEAIAEAFVQEVRRFYPFFPAVPAKVRETFRWGGYEFEAGTRALLDLHGTNHDERIWDFPEEFQPRRFLRWDGNAFAFVPQGGGDHLQHHRCPGEWLTIELMRQALAFFTSDIDYSVPRQNLELDTRRLPAMPDSRMILSNIALR